ncbi:hypothetical protein CDAR_186141 [Caerostris darwini]|uniref:Uncharacterized protein n=1 Tax=Caerostris darwini TaxID=1538125 RepID=A0AAV4WEP6_9ARAC|nr:hypothetical protein CDAR_186141 [Caerostris darwini]
MSLLMPLCRFSIERRGHDIEKGKNILTALCSGDDEGSSKQSWPGQCLEDSGECCFMEGERTCADLVPKEISDLYRIVGDGFKLKLRDQTGNICLTNSAAKSPSRQQFSFDIRKQPTFTHVSIRFSSVCLDGEWLGRCWRLKSSSHARRISSCFRLSVCVRFN